MLHKYGALELSYTAGWIVKGTTTLEKSLAISQQVKHIPTVKEEFVFLQDWSTAKAIYRWFITIGDSFLGWKVLK